MNRSNLRVAISGASGRMGFQLIQSFLFNIDPQLAILSAAITHHTSKYIGSDIGKLVSGKPVGIIVNDSIEAICDDFDVLIDFSNSQATLEYLRFCNKNNKNMIIGTTGFKKEELFLIEEASKNIGIVFSPNFSVLMTLMLKLLENSASIIGSCSDIEIMEIHHRNKRDVPSGTSLMMKQVLTKALSVSKNQIKDAFFLKRQGECDIKINAMRAGDTVGEHSVFFINMGERLEIVHRSFNRIIFANGAIHAAIWLGNRKVGLFDMIDVLGLDSF